MGFEILDLMSKIHRDMEDNIYNFTENGKCSSCGSCCSNLLPLSQKEISDIRKYIKKNHIKECVHAFYPSAKPTFDMTCPFRDNEKRICTIYKVRPMICREFVCDSEKRVKENRKFIGEKRNVYLVRELFFRGDA